MKRQSHLAPTLLMLSICALALGGYGGSMQISRLLLLLLWPAILLKIANLKAHPVSPLQQRLLLFVSALLALSLISLTWSIDIVKSIEYILVLIINTTPLVMIALMSGDELAASKRLIPRAWLISVTAILPFAFYEITTGDHSSLGLDERGGGSISELLPFASGLHGNFNDFSLYLIFCLFGSSYAVTSSRRNSLHLFTVAIMLSTAFIIIANGSRAVILSMLGLFLFHFLIQKNLLRVTRNLVALATVSALLISRIDSDSIQLQFLLFKFTDFSSDLEGNEGRFAVFFAGIDGLTSTLGLGAGAGASSILLARNPTVLIPNPHNLFLEWILNFGIIGFMLFLHFLASLWQAIFVNCNWQETKNGIAFLIFLPIMGIAQSHLTGYTYFWLALATLVTFSMPIKKQF